MNAGSTITGTVDYFFLFFFLQMDEHHLHTQLHLLQHKSTNLHAKEHFCSAVSILLHRSRANWFFWPIIYIKKENIPNV